MATIEKKILSFNKGGEDIYLFTLTNKNGTKVSITNYGAIISSFCVNGQNIVLGFNDIQDYFATDYLQSYPYFGCSVGRYANRIKNAAFVLNGVTIKLSKNNNEYHLHGGFEGFGQKVWRIRETGKEDELTLTYTSVHLEEGYPGNLQVTTAFSLSDNNELLLKTTAFTDLATIINLTHHDYFNLDGSPTITEHLVKINSQEYLEQDEEHIVTGKLIPAVNSIYDFTQFRKVNKNWNEKDGYDQTYVLNNSSGQLVPAASCKSEKNKLLLEVFTTEPVVHFYTGKWNPVIERNGKKLFGPFSGLCFETQKEPNAINADGLSNTILLPGEQYTTQTIYKVSPLAEEK